jgi:hypothetical protein
MTAQLDTVFRQDNHDVSPIPNDNSQRHLARDRRADSALPLVILPFGRTLKLKLSFLL